MKLRSTLPVLLVALVVLLLSWTLQSEAVAAPQVSAPTSVSECLNGNSPPQYFVYDFTALGHQTRYFCGDYTKGILHTEAGHPGLDNTYFAACIDLLFSAGNPGPKQSNGNYLWTGLYLKSGKYYPVYGVVIESSYISGEWQVQTAYTQQGTNGNDWRACGTYARSVGYRARHYSARRS